MYIQNAVEKYKIIKIHSARALSDDLESHLAFIDSYYSIHSVYISTNLLCDRFKINILFFLIQF